MKSFLHVAVLAILCAGEAQANGGADPYVKTLFADPANPVTTCPNANYVVARAGMNADVGNPYFIYAVDPATGAVTMVPGLGLRNPGNPAQAIDVNGIGLNAIDGFFYGLANDASSGNVTFVRFDQNYGIKLLGVIPAPTSPTGLFGFVNSAAGDVDRSNNFYFTAATANPAPGTPTGLAIDKLFLGKLTAISSLAGAASPAPEYFEIDYSEAPCASYISTFNTDPTNSGLKDFVFNPFTNTFFTYVTYKLAGAGVFSGQMIELRPVAGSAPQVYKMFCTPVINTHSAEVSGTLIDNAGNFLVLMTDGTIGQIGSPSPGVYNGIYAPLNNSTGLPNPLRGDMASCGGPGPVATVWYRDFDGDGFGNPAKSISATTQPAGYVSNNQDCNDYRVYYQDTDNDGWGNSTKLPCGLITRTNDCDDNNNKVHSPQTFYRDADGDSWGNPAVTTVVCSSVPPTGYVKNRMDCNDNNKQIRYCPPPTITGNGNRVVPDLVVPQLAAAKLTVYPNPVAGGTRFTYTLPAEGRVSITIVDLAGREVAAVFDGRRAAGAHFVAYNVSALSPGVYLCRMVVNTGSREIVQTERLVKLY